MIRLATGVLLYFAITVNASGVRTGSTYLHADCGPKVPGDVLYGDATVPTLQDVMSNAFQIDDYSSPYFLNYWHESIFVYEKNNRFHIDFTNSQGLSFTDGRILQFKATEDEIDFRVMFLSHRAVLLYVNGTMRVSSVDTVEVVLEFSGIAVDIGIYPSHPMKVWFVSRKHTDDGFLFAAQPCIRQEVCICEDGPRGAWCRVGDCDVERSCRDGGWGGGGTCIWQSQNGGLLSWFILFPAFYISKRLQWKIIHD